MFRKSMINFPFPNPKNRDLTFHEIYLPGLKKLTNKMSGRSSSARQVAVVGDCGVGKTSLILNLVCGSVDLGGGPSQVATTSICHTITLPSGQVALDIWDTVGQERYRSLISMTLRGALVGIICFCPELNPGCAPESSAMKDACTASVRTWIEVFRTGNPAAKLLLAATKSDLFPDIKTELKALADALANELGFEATFITSAATGENVADLFACAAQIAQSADVDPSPGPGPEPIEKTGDISCW
jgi:Ras-related protein Rab-6A